MQNSVSSRFFGAERGLVRGLGFCLKRRFVEFFRCGGENREMEILSILRFVHDHNDKVIGSLVALFLITSIALLIRSLKEKGEGHGDIAQNTNGNMNIDLEAIEDRVRKVIASQPVSVRASEAVSATRPAAPQASEASTSSDDSEKKDDQVDEVGLLTQIVSERDQQVADLMTEIEKLKSAISAGGPSADGGATGDVVDLKNQLAELQARLAEYEIIEDDIADLSLYKDENIRLKAEVEELNEKLKNASETAPKSKVNAGPETELKFEKAERFELSPDDDIMKQFAEAVSGGDGAKETVNVEKIAQEETAKDDAAKDDASEQVKMDDIVAAAEEAATAELPEDPQAAIDALLAEAQSENQPETPAEPEAKPLPKEDDDVLAAVAATVSAMSDEPSAVADMPAALEAEGPGPLDGELDTDKMLSEVESLKGPESSDADSGEADALLESLDTDKLLEEVSTLKTLEGTQGTSEEGDDLFAEFKKTGEG